MLLPQQLMQRHAEHRERYFAHPVTRPMGAGYELLARCKDGRQLPVEISLSPLETDEGLLIISVIRDVTERHKAAEALRKAHDDLEMRVQERTAELVKANAEKEQMLQQLLKAEKLAEIGQLAAGVAHEIRNPLGGIRGAIEVLRENRIERDSQLPIMDEILQRVDRLNASVKDLLEYAKPMSPNFAVVSVNDLLDSALATLQHDARLHGIQVKKEHLPPVSLRTDAALLERVFINIILNAAQAMKTHGTLRVTLNADDRHVIVVFSDTGPGIDPGVVEKIFDPFFTTRSEGSGLGLALCKKYVEILNGSIEVQTQPGAGSTFTVSLPQTQGL